jgi:hypothetical protein
MANIERQIEIRRQQIARLQEEVETLQRAQALLGRRKRGWPKGKKRGRRKGSAGAKSAKATSKRTYTRRGRPPKAAKAIAKVGRPAKKAAKAEQQGQTRQES